MNTRRTQILFALLKKSEGLNTKELVCNFGVSERSIRYDIKAIDDFLKEHGFRSLIKENGRVLLPDSLKGEKKILGLVSESGIDLNSTILPSDQRMYFIINELLLANSFITINHCAYKMLVSRNTVVNDMKKIKKWLRDNGIELVSIPKHGEKVLGQEVDIRNALMRLYREALSFEQYVGLSKETFGENSENTYPNILFRRLFDKTDVREIHAGIRVLQDRLHVAFSDAAYVELLLCLAVIIQRLRMGKTVVMGEKENSLLKKTSTFRILQQILKTSGDTYGLNVTPDEVLYISQYVFSSTNLSMTDLKEDPDNLDLQMLIGNLIANVSKSIHLDLTNDLGLFQCLDQEIGTIIFRKKHTIRSYNPYLKDIISGYPELFEAVKANIGPLQFYTGNQISDGEIGFIVQHFAALLEKYGRVNALLVCGTGFGTANLLSARLKAMFNINIVGAVSFHEISDIASRSPVDLIITTIPFVYEKIPCVLVNPTLSQEDILRLRKYIVLNRGKSSGTAARNELPRAARNTGGAGQEDENISNHFTIGLKEILPADNIRIGVNETSWKGAVEFGGNVLYENGYVGKGFVNSLIEAIENVGPYMVFWKGIALPHCNNFQDVRRVGVSFVKLRNPVAFGNPANDPVDMLFVFATPNRVCHLNALRQLCEMLNDEKTARRLREEKDVEGVLKIVRSLPEVN